MMCGRSGARRLRAVMSVSGPRSPARRSPRSGDAWGWSSSARAPATESPCRLRRPWWRFDPEAAARCSTPKRAQCSDRESAGRFSLSRSVPSRSVSAAAPPPLNRAAALSLWRHPANHSIVPAGGGAVSDAQGERRTATGKRAGASLHPTPARFSAQAPLPLSPASSRRRKESPYCHPPCAGRGSAVAKMAT